MFSTHSSALKIIIFNCKQKLEILWSYLLIILQTFIISVHWPHALLYKIKYTLTALSELRG